MKKKAAQEVAKVDGKNTSIAKSDYTPAELARVKAFTAKYKKLTVSFVKEKNNKEPLQLAMKWDENKPELALVELQEASGTCSYELFSGLLGQTSNASGLTTPDKAQLLMAVFRNMSEIAPQDFIEGMLASQMIAAHNNLMYCLNAANNPEQYFDTRVSYMSLANKFMRTFTNQIEALNKHRGKGQQKVIVEHVHVNAGGQAIVGNVTKKGGGEN